MALLGADRAPSNAAMTQMTLDQLRVLVTVADAGSFSGAARRLRRAQSAVSHAIATLEGQLQVQLFDRTARLPRLTTAGRELLARARTVVDDVERMKDRATEIAGGAQPELSLAVDTAFPMEALLSSLAHFRDAYPNVSLRLFGESLGAVAQRVADGECEIGISTIPTYPSGLVARRIAQMELVPVAARTHPLASISGAIPLEVLRAHVQIVLTDRSPLTEGAQFGVAGGKAWYVADLAAKHALIQAGFGFGNLPTHLIRNDLASGAMVPLSGAPWPAEPETVPIFLVHREVNPPGAAAQWLIEQLASGCAACAPRAPRPAQLAASETVAA